MNKKILAYTLGNGHISKKGKLYVTCREEQKEYLEWKAREIGADIFSFEKEGIVYYQLAYNIFNKRDKGKEIRKKLYGVLKHKYFSREIIESLDDFCIAIWYLDKGSLRAKKKNGKIHAYEIFFHFHGLKSECLELIKMFKEKYDIDFTLKFNKGKYSIRCGTKSTKKFLSIVRAQVPEFNCFKNNKLQHI